ncbi:hypothetical protein COL91_10760 [Bacillus pseudomycoides]|nr:hypothetical protein COO02_22075 [Bacillus pseudomycoides]PEI93476.1 hypothetical protein CN679_08305 [Bacillus pseudomycoides]PGA91269.1 hypothetical protein COL91_10760 [Bacillus pseudomycoides]PHF49234.1 hypothetical protein COF72_08490 [Bacillus pseudomycoides]
MRSSGDAASHFFAYKFRKRDKTLSFWCGKECPSMDRSGQSLFSPHAVLKQKERMSLFVYIAVIYMRKSQKYEVFFVKFYHFS